MTKPRVALERIWDASVEDVWELWTTKDGIESWWGPEGFAVTVQSIDLRPSGVLLYTMTAVAEETIAFMKQAGQPLSSSHRVTYVEIEPRHRLSYDHVVDFVPDIEPYEVRHTVEIEPHADGVRMVLSFDPMHSNEWTGRAKMGWESELGKLAKQLAARK